MKRTSTNMKLVLGAVILSVIVGGAGWAFASERSGPRRPQPPMEPQKGKLGTPIRYSEKPRLTGPTISDGRPAPILAAILERYNGNAVVKASFGSAPQGWRGTEDPSIPLPPLYRGGRWLYTTVSATGPGAPAVRAIWEANLIAGALRDELHLAGVQGALIGSEVSIQLPDGSMLPDKGGGVGNVVFGQGFAADDPAVVESEVRAAARELNLRVKSVEVLTALQSAPALVVATEDPAGFLKAENLRSRLFGLPPTYEGYYLEAVDGSGRPFLATAAVFRTGVSQTWIRPDLASPRTSE